MSTTDSDSLFHRDLNQEYPVMVRGEGIYLVDEEGRRYMDGTSGAGNVILGHGNKRIAAAMAEQAGTLAYCFSAFHTNRPARELSQRIAALAPGDLDCVYFVSGGSEGIETALKIARQYHLQQGNKQKYRVIGRWRGYHGATLGALSATGMPALREPFSPWLLPFHHIAPCYPYRCSFRRLRQPLQLQLRRRAREGDPPARARQRRRLRRRAGGPGGHRRRRPPGGVLRHRARDLRQVRRALHRRRDHHRLRPHR